MKLKSVYVFVMTSIWFSMTLATFTPAFAQQLRLDTPLVTREIRYNNSEAGEVALVWGVNGWEMLPEALRPAGTTTIKLNNDAMRTPMLHDGGIFVAKVQVPAGSQIDYIFQISKTRSGVTTEAWDTSNLTEKQFHIVADQDGSTIVNATVVLAELLYTSPADTSVQLMSTFVLLGLSLVLVIIIIRIRFRNPFLEF